MRKTLLGTVAALALLGLAAVSGCLISGTKVFTHPLADIPVSAGGGFSRASVDLTEDDTFDEHRDEIRLIDRFGFTCDIVNSDNTDGKISVYLSTEPNLLDPEVPTQATPLFLDLVVPAGSTRHIGYDESLSLIQNFQALQAAIETGRFTFYAQTITGFDILIDDPVLVITFTVGL